MPLSESRTRLFVSLLQLGAEESPKFLNKEEMAEIDKAYIRAADDFHRSHGLVRQYLQARNGREPTIADRNGISDRLEKLMMIAQELLQLELYGPTRHAPFGSSTLLYQRPRTSLQSHRQDIREYKIANYCDSSQDGDDEGDVLDEEDQEFLRQQASQVIRTTNDEVNTEICEDGEHFRQWRERIAIGAFIEA
ncbi:MAG: hypothetical protein Q9173_006401 [Seirophora scorigena]